MMGRGQLDYSISLLTILNHPPRESIYTFFSKMKLLQSTLCCYIFKWSGPPFVLETQVARLQILASPLPLLTSVAIISTNVSSIFCKTAFNSFFAYEMPQSSTKHYHQENDFFVHTTYPSSMHKKVVFYWFPSMTYGAWIIPYFT